jgi:hypothetical protein
MSTTIDPSTIDNLDPGAAGAGDAPGKLPRQRTRREGGACGNCGFEDTGHYCSRCGEPLHGTQDTVLEILWSDMVEGPLHNLFALGKTTWLILLHPRHFFGGVLKRKRGLTSFPFFLAPAWRRVSHKPHGVPNAVKYFVLIYTLGIVGGWAFGVDMFPTVHLPFGKYDKVLPGLVSEPLILLLVVVAAWMYAAAVSRLLGGRIDTEVLTKFMLYLNGFALIPLVGMAVAGEGHLKLFLVCLGFWLYALFVLPQVALPELFGISRARLGFAQAGAAVANGVIIVGMLFFAGAAVDLVAPGWMERNARVASDRPGFDPAASGISAVQAIAQSTVFPVDTLLGLLTPGRSGRRDAAASVTSPAFRRKGARAAPILGAAAPLFPLDTLGALIRFPADAYPTEHGETARRGGLRGRRGR